jgi:hypothetical protein
VWDTDDTKKTYRERRAERERQLEEEQMPGVVYVEQKGTWLLDVSVMWWW